MLTVIYTTLLQGTRLSHLFMKFLTCFNALSAGDHSCQRDGGPRDPTVQLHWSPEKWPGVWAHLQQKVSQRKGTDHSKCHISCLCMYWILNIILYYSYSDLIFFLSSFATWQMKVSEFFFLIDYKIFFIISKIAQINMGRIRNYSFRIQKTALKQSQIFSLAGWMKINYQV